MNDFDVIIIGAGAAGLMCAWEAAKHGRKVCVIEHTQKIGEKIRISGGGRCNFTNLYSTPANFLSQNPHFCKSALSRYTPNHFTALLDDRGIAYHEKPFEEKTGNENARGQMFCDHSAQDIITMLCHGCEAAGAEFKLGTKVSDVRKTETGFEIETNQSPYTCQNLVVASGGLSIPKIGASNFGYELAKKFGLEIVPPRAALVPLTFHPDLLSVTKDLSGIAVDAFVSCGKARFREGLLFTHRGLSGPSILQVSSYWHEGEPVIIDLTPEIDILAFLKEGRTKTPKQMVHTVLAQKLPARLVGFIIGDLDGRIADSSDKKLEAVAQRIKNWQITPSGSEGYRTAEVTLGGVDTSGFSSKTFEANAVKGLYFIGEVLDVTGHLGGHNFQWAWASGWCAGQAV